jgi:hypothetical protein
MLHWLKTHKHLPSIGVIAAVGVASLYYHQRKTKLFLQPKEQPPWLDAILSEKDQYILSIQEHSKTNAPTNKATYYIDRETFKFFKVSSTFQFF